MNGQHRIRRILLSAGVLGLIWAVCGVLVWLIISTEPAGIAWSVYIPGLVTALVVLTGLAASRMLPELWSVGFTPVVYLPRWVWGALVLSVGGTVLLSFIGAVSGLIATSVALTAGAIAYTIAVLGGRDDRSSRSPLWLVVVIGVLAVTTVGIGAVVEGASLLTVVFYLALLLFGYHVGFVLPMALLEAGSRHQPSELDAHPGVDILIPAYNESGVVGECIEAVLALEYPADRLDIVVIDDGSTDGTFAEAAQFRDSGVRVLRRTNGGKHAALNMALACTSNPYVVTVDADSRPEPAALEQTIACLVADADLGALSAAVLPENDGGLLGGLQRLEYAVSNTNRRAYSAFEAVPVVPGCFGAYRRKALESVWGLDPDTVTEDFDLTVRLLRDGWTVRHGPATVWTIVPGSWHELWRQRLRWYRGGLETIRKHWDVLSAPEHGYLHGLTLPARTVSQLFSPLASYVILVAVVAGLILGPTGYLMTLLAIFFVLTVLIALFSVVLEEEPLWTLVAAPLLFVGYKHVIDASVAVGSVGALVGDAGRWDRPTTDHGVPAD